MEPHDRGPPQLSLVAVLDRLAEVLNANEGRHRWEIVWVDGRVVEAHPHQEPGKITREALDAVTFPLDR